MEGVYELSESTFEAGNAIALLIAATALYILPFKIAGFMAALAIGFEMWIIPQYLKENGIDKAQKGYILVSVLFFLAALLFGARWAMSLGYVAFHFLFCYVFELFCVDDEKVAEEEFHSRLAKILKPYEQELQDLRGQLKKQLSLAEYESKIKVFRQTIEAEYRVRMQDQAIRYERRLKRLEDSRDESAKKQIRELEYRFQQENERIQREQETKISEYVSELDKLQNALLKSKQEIEREKKRADSLERELSAWKSSQNIQPDLSIVLRAEIQRLNTRLEGMISMEEYQQAIKEIQLEAQKKQDALLNEIQLEYEQKLQIVEREKEFIQNESVQKDKLLHDKELLIQDAKNNYFKQIAEVKEEFQKKYDVLNQEFIKYRKEQDEFIRERERHAHNKMLRNAEIRSEINRIVKKACKEIDIISPWMNDGVVDQFFLDALNRAAGRGVTIKILYGIGDLSGSDEKAPGKDKSDKTRKTAGKIRRGIYYKNRLHMKRGNEHSKLILCDDAYYIITSFNPLSFRGDYTGRDQRGEIGEISCDKENLQVYRQKYFDFTGIEIK